jgi:hypothetical protein
LKKIGVVVEEELEKQAVFGLLLNAGLPILTLNFKTFKEIHDYISQPCIMPGDVPCYLNARIGELVYLNIWGI